MGRARLSLIAILLTAGCGELSSKSPLLNEPKPVGALMVQGSLEGQNGKTASGAAVVYRQTSDNSHVLRLEGIQVPDEGPYNVVGLVDGSERTLGVLKSTRGSHNYSAGQLGSATWSTVYIRKAGVSLDAGNYARATLLSPN